MTTTRTQLLTQLLDSPARLEAAEQELCRTQAIAHACKEDLADREAAALLFDELKGKNAETRAAEIRVLTTLHRQALQQAQEEAQVAACRLRALQEEAKSLRAASRLICEGDDDA